MRLSYFELEALDGEPHNKPFSLMIAADNVQRCSTFCSLNNTDATIHLCATCFGHLRQIRRIRKSLDAGSTATLVHAFVTSRVDYCNVVLAESPRSITDKLRRVMIAAARVISNTQKYDSRLSLLRHEELHWLDVIDRVRYKLAVLACRSLHGSTPQYLTSLLT